MITLIQQYIHRIILNYTYNAHMHKTWYGKYLTWISNPVTYGGHGSDTIFPGILGGQHSRPSHTIGHSDLFPETVYNLNQTFQFVDDFVKNKTVRSINA